METNSAFCEAMGFTQHWYRYLFVLVIPLVVGWFALCRPAQMAAPAYYAATSWAQPERVRDEPKAKEVKEVVLKRIEHYREQSDELARNVYYWVLLIGLTILILSQKKKDGIQLLGVKIPAGARHMLVVVSMLYLWIDFGGMLKALIYERMALWKLIDQLEGPLAKDGVALTSLRPLLLGKPFLDWWFREFLPDFSMAIPTGDQNKFVNGVLFIASRFAVGTMIGLAHASAFVMLDDAKIVWAKENKPLSVGISCLQFVCAAIIILCYLYFQQEGHGGMFFWWCSFAAALGIVLMPGIKLLRGGKVSKSAILIG